jgi:WhiB family transcriptional regulator, redox-sensing transcriptional regulator
MGDSTDLTGMLTAFGDGWDYAHQNANATHFSTWSARSTSSVRRQADALSGYEHPEWMERANCLGLDVDLFVPEDAPLGITKRICRRCEVVDECLTYALADRGLAGVWGATTYADRERIWKVEADDAA